MTAPGTGEGRHALADEQQQSTEHRPVEQEPLEVRPAQGQPVEVRPAGEPEQQQGVEAQPDPADVRDGQAEPDGRTEDSAHGSDSVSVQVTEAPADSAATGVEFPALDTLPSPATP